MKYRKETIIFSSIVSITSVFFHLIPVLKGVVSFEVVSLSISALVYFILAFVGVWLGQVVAGRPFVVKSMYWIPALVYLLPHQISKLMGLYTSMPLVHFILVVLVAFAAGWRLPNHQNEISSENS